jgi:hypothetical protein
VTRKPAKPKQGAAGKQPAATDVDPATDGRGAKHLEEWAWQWKTELMDAGRFIDAVDSGKAPPQAFIAKLARALRELFCHRDTETSLRAFARILGVKQRRGKGRRQQTAAEAEPGYLGALQMVERERALQASGVLPRSARSKSVREFANTSGVPLRTVQHWRRIHGDSARMLIKAAATRRKK